MKSGALDWRESYVKSSEIDEDRTLDEISNGHFFLTIEDMKNLSIAKNIFRFQRFRIT